MKASWVVSALLMSLGLFNVPACGGKSSVGTHHKNNGGQGGQGGADTTGVAGSGAGPATHFTECEKLCNRSEVTSCTGANAASCLMVCATVTGYASCQSQIDEWLSCSETSAITCDTSGTPTFSDCNDELTSVGVCAMATPPPKAVAKSCEDYCDEVDAAGCSTDSTLGDCSQTCGVAAMVVAVCQADFVAMLNCQSKVGVTCDANGNPTTTGCGSEQITYTGCVMTEVGRGTQTTGGVGGVGATN